MTTKHTPAPWRYVRQPGGGIIVGYSQDSHHVRIAAITAISVEDFGAVEGETDNTAAFQAAFNFAAEQMANGHLLAAAPRLLACAQKVIEREAVGDLAGAIRELSDAVKEATKS